MVSTMTLVDSLEEQTLLEQILEDSKPRLPVECQGLHYLLFTPFRYGALYPHGSRFRRAGLTPGIFYASHQVTTAVAEMAFRRLLFYAESPSTPWPANAGDYTAFAVRLSGKGLDLTRPPLDADAAQWLHPTDYGPCQGLGDTARDAGVKVLRYHSARHEGSNIALLSCSAFRSREPVAHQRWKIHLGPTGVRAIGELQEHRVEFGREAFARDPRIASLTWER